MSEVNGAEELYVALFADDRSMNHIIFSVSVFVGGGGGGSCRRTYQYGSLSCSIKDNESNRLLHEAHFRHGFAQSTHQRHHQRVILPLLTL